jgi:hypothetical protein
MWTLLKPYKIFIVCLRGRYLLSIFGKVKLEVIASESNFLLEFKVFTEKDVLISTRVKIEFRYKN